MLSPVTTSASAERRTLPRYRNSSDEIDPNIITAGSQASQYEALSIRSAVNTNRCKNGGEAAAKAAAAILQSGQRRRANQPHTRLATSATSLSLRSCIAGS